MQFKFISSGRLLSNISKKLSKLMSESELISKLTANVGGATYVSGVNQQQQQQQSTNNVDHSAGQDMDIDILQVRLSCCDNFKICRF